MKIAIIGAMEKEVNQLIKKLKLKQKQNNFLKIYLGTYNNIDILVCESGIGKVNSAINTQYIIDNYRPNYIINTGCCGALSTNLKVFDIVIGKFTTYHDFNPDRIMKIATPDNGLIETTKNLVSILEEIVKKENLSYQIGVIATGDCYITNDKMRDEVYKKTNALAVDMESCSIAHTCKKNNIPFLIIRTISDFSDGTFDFEEKASNISSDLVIKVLDKID